VPPEVVGEQRKGLLAVEGAVAEVLRLHLELELEDGEDGFDVEHLVVHDQDPLRARRRVEALNLDLLGKEFRFIGLIPLNEFTPTGGWILEEQRCRWRFHSLIIPKLG